MSKTDFIIFPSEYKFFILLLFYTVPNSFMICSPVTEARKLRVFLSHHSSIHIQLITSFHVLLIYFQTCPFLLLSLPLFEGKASSFPTCMIALDSKLASPNPSILYCWAPSLTCKPGFWSSPLKRNWVIGSLLSSVT